MRFQPILAQNRLCLIHDVDLYMRLYSIYIHLCGEVGVKIFNKTSLTVNGNFTWTHLIRVDFASG